MEAEAVLAEARTNLKRLQAKRAHLRSQLAEVEAELADVRSDVAALEALGAKYGFAEPDEPDEDMGGGWLQLNRQEAVLRALRDLGRPASLREVFDHLRLAGREGDELPLISAALSALREKGSVQMVKRGVWQVAPMKVTTSQSVPGHLAIPPLVDTTPIAAAAQRISEIVAGGLKEP